MDAQIIFGLSPAHLALACLLALIAGFIKGTVGFAMPMILISGLGSFLSPELALAGLILPTLGTNLWQAMRNGFGAAIASGRKHWRYISVLMVCIALSAQLVTRLPGWSLFLILGVPVTIFAAVQLAGWRPRIDPLNRGKAEIGVGALAGVIGGLSGVWGPPTVLYLTALDTAKSEQMRVQGVVYGIGAVMLTAAHLRSGVLTASSIPLSALLLFPAGIGMAVGYLFHDRLDQVLFRRLTLAVLVVAGLNLVRRGLLG